MRQASKASWPFALKSLLDFVAQGAENSIGQESKEEVEADVAKHTDANAAPAILATRLSLDRIINLNATWHQGEPENRRDDQSKYVADPEDTVGTDVMPVGVEISWHPAAQNKNGRQHSRETRERSCRRPDEKRCKHQVEAHKNHAGLPGVYARAFHGDSGYQRVLQ